MLRYYGVAANPEVLSDNEWALRIIHLKNIREKEAKSSSF